MKNSKVLFSCCLYCAICFAGVEESVVHAQPVSLVSNEDCAELQKQNDYLQEENDLLKGDKETIRANLRQCREDLQLPQRTQNVQAVPDECQTDLEKTHDDLELCQDQQARLADEKRVLRERLEDTSPPCAECPQSICECRDERLALDQCRRTRDEPKVDPPVPASAGCKLLFDSAWDSLVPSVPIYPGDYRVPDSLRGIWATESHIQIDRKFFIMTREVSIHDFQRYRDKRVSGVQNPNSPGPPVAEISWQQANDYADWVAQETGCQVSLPSYEQWLATSVVHATPKDANIRRHVADTSTTLEMVEGPPSKPRHLLGNLSEWSSSSCDNNSGYRLLGYSYQTVRQDLLRDEAQAENRCKYPNGLSTIGFRLVWSPEQS